MTHNEFLARIKFKQALHFKIVANRAIDLLVIHSAEIGESLDGAEALLNVCASKRVGADGKEIVSSWHYACDADSITQSVRDRDVAFHAPGANNNGIGIELSGRAKQTAEEWQDPYSFALLMLLSKFCAVKCAEHNIPIEFRDVEALKDGGARGITTHNAVSKAFGKSKHWDPGPHFPMDQLLASARYWSGSEEIS